MGDPYFRYQGNGGFDVRHYDIAFSYDPATRRMNATTTVTAVATQNLDRFDLDFRGPDISMLTVNGTTAGFQRAGQELIITPGSSLPSGRVFTVVVKYAGVPPVITDPDGSIEGWVPTDDGAFVVGEPQGAPAWFPGNDHPTNKATFTFHATVPEGTTAVGNGRLLSQTTASGWTTFVWDSTEPMATYLATVTIGKFEITESTTPSGIPIYTAVDPRLVKRSAAAVAQIPDIIDYYRQTFGPYPFSSTGAIIDYAPNVGYALETQTRPVFCDVPSNAVGTMAHELAHQWFATERRQGKTIIRVSVRTRAAGPVNEGGASTAIWVSSRSRPRECGARAAAHTDVRNEPSLRAARRSFRNPGTPIDSSTSMAVRPSTPGDRAPWLPATRSNATNSVAGSCTKLNRSSNRRPGSATVQR
ncbi:M1 family metallopeptidase [Streptomyces sp. NPDC058440]|uniref:M1 family metallopeptidase n=1 Tax=Streptomyces sp. NPDC058440 TaxID=3346501 RepID=UPI0036460FF1